MLSAANPPDPPCSSTSPALNSDEKGHPSERPSPSSEADPTDGPEEAYTPRFCLRDYVFASRGKDVGTNWPFRQQYLRLCVKHGIRDLLPPFEPPDLVRSRFTQTDRPILCSELVKGTQTEASDALKNVHSSPTQESVLDFSHQCPNLSSEDKSAAIAGPSESGGRLLESRLASYDHAKSAPSSDSQLVESSVPESRSTVSELLSEVEVAKPPRVSEIIRGPSERPVKKCRLIVKFGGALEPRRSEDTASHFSSVTDPMASKVCPVCKSFSSTSNTTLNAHIDQCLSVESGAKQNLSTLAHHKVKPRKKRSMEEICATAPRCTLEDLDRRNGTNWASDLASMAQRNEISCTPESKQPRISHLADAKRKGAVYIDSNGTKLLILSNFDDVQSAAAVDSTGTIKCRKETKNGCSTVGKRKCFAPRIGKYLKAKVQRKKTTSFGQLNGEMHRVPKHHADNYSEERINLTSRTQEQVKLGRPGTLGHWICSKRSRLKHLNSYSGNKGTTNPPDIGHRRAVDTNHSVRGRGHKLGKSSDEISSASNTRSTDVLLDDAHASLNQGKSANLCEKNDDSIGNCHSPSNQIMQKLTRSSKNLVCSVKGKRGEMHSYAVQKSNKFQRPRKASVDCPFQKCKRGRGPRSFLTDGEQHTWEIMKCKEVSQGATSTNLGNQLSGDPQEPVEESPSELVVGSLVPSSMPGLGLSSDSLTCAMQSSNFTETVGTLEMSNTSDHVSQHHDNPMGSDEVDAYNNVSGGGDFYLVNHTQLQTECCRDEGTKLNVQSEVPVNMDSLAMGQQMKSVGNCCSKILNAEDLQVNDCDNPDACLSNEYEREPNSINEATGEASAQNSLGDQRTNPGISAVDLAQQDIWQANRIKPHVKNGYCSVLQNMADLEDITSTRDPTACLTRSTEKFQEPTSATSGRGGAAEIHYMMVDGEPSGSPVSASSTLSHLSVEDLKSKDGEQDPLREHMVIQEKLRLDCRNMRLPMYENMTSTERTKLERNYQELSGMPSPEDPEKFWGGQPCCCSQRERVPVKTRTLRQNSISGTMLPSNSPIHMNSMVSSSGTYLHSTSGSNATPIFNEPNDSISVRTSPDFAMGFPAFGCLGSASPSSHTHPSNNSNPVLRLMGKDLMVIKKEETPIEHQNQCPPSENTSNGKYMSLLGYSSTCSFSNVDAMQFHSHSSLGSSIFSGQHPSNAQVPVALGADKRTCCSGSLFQSVDLFKADSRSRDKMLGKKPNLSATYNVGTLWTSHERQTLVPFTKAPSHGREVIVIDDSPELENEYVGNLQNPSSNIGSPFSGSEIRQFRSFCYPSSTAVQLRDRCGPRPGFPTSCPRLDANSTRWGGTADSSVPLLQGYFVAPPHSANRATSSLYHSRSIQ